MYLSVIIPAFNEEERIPATLQSVVEYLKRQYYTYEIIVVDDGSTDSTPALVGVFAEHNKNIRLIRNDKNHGKGWVVRQGMLAATGTHRLFMDADNSTSIDHIETMFPEMKKGADVVISSRRIKGAVIEVPQTPLRDFLGGVFRWIVRIMVPLGVIDSQNGFKLFSARAADSIFRRQRTFTWAFDVEVLAIAKQEGYTIKEIPIHWVNDGRTRVTPFGMFFMLIEIIEIRINLWLGSYRTSVAQPPKAR